jgi:hypothetical protein
MPFSRFDIAVAGDSLAAQMAAALLAKRGRRIIRVAAPGHHDPWQHASLFLDKLLDTVGGQACHCAYQPFQVLAPRARVTICPELPLADELAREFGSAAAPVLALLDHLEQVGKMLEEALWEHGGLPGGGVREAATWRWRCLRRKLPPGMLSASLARRVQAISEPAVEWLRDLFQGLALQPLAALTVADGALLWTHARRPAGVAGAALHQLLQQRFEQFHGVETSLASLAALEHRDGLWVGTRHDGGTFQAGQLILGDLDLELPGRGLPLPHAPLTPPQHLVTSPLDGQLSPLLTKRVIAGGPHPMRLVLSPAARGMIACISASVIADEAQIRNQLEPVLPFARYTLEHRHHGRSSVRLAGPSNAAPPLGKVPFRLGSHLWCADETRLLPQCGSGGAALLAWTLARQLDAPRSRQRH